MKKIICILAVLPLLLTACDIETSDNGDFDGYWHLVSVDTLATSGHCDLSGNTIFWAVQFKLMRLRGAERIREGGNGREFYERFELSRNSLTLFDPHEKNREKEDPAITEERLLELRPYGINALRERFEILLLDKDEMVLKSSVLELRFRKR